MKPGPDKSQTPELSPLERLVAARQAEKQAQRKRDTRVLAVVVAAVLLLVGGGAFALVRLAPRSLLHPSAHPAPSVRVTATPRLISTRQPVLNAAPASAFLGSPAEGWADGAAGISVPAGRAHGPYTAAQVRSALETTRRLLIAGNLDWPTLHGGTPAAFAGLLTSQERQEFMAGLHTTALNHDGSERNTRTWVSSFAPGTRFVTTVIKVHGTMSASTATDSGSEVLRVKVNFLFVYAVEPAGNPADWMRIVQHRYGYVDFARWDDPGGALEPWYSVAGQTGGAGAPVDPYSLATPSALSGSGCHATTGT